MANRLTAHGRGQRNRADGAYVTHRSDMKNPARIERAGRFGTAGFDFRGGSDADVHRVEEAGGCLLDAVRCRVDCAHSLPQVGLLAAKPNERFFRCQHVRRFFFAATCIASTHQVHPVHVCTLLRTQVTRRASNARNRKSAFLKCFSTCPCTLHIDFSKSTWRARTQRAALSAHTSCRASRTHKMH